MTHPEGPARPDRSVRHGDGDAGGDVDVPLARVDADPVPGAPGDVEATDRARAQVADQAPGPRDDDAPPMGRPLNRRSPFFVGFIGAIGVFIAYGLVTVVQQPVVGDHPARGGAVPGARARPGGAGGRAAGAPPRPGRGAGAAGGRAAVRRGDRPRGAAGRHRGHRAGHERTRLRAEPAEEQGVPRPRRPVRHRDEGAGRACRSGPPRSRSGRRCSAVSSVPRRPWCRACSAPSPCSS
nr:hypothetical protein [Angustibacter aerolatus]